MVGHKSKNINIKTLIVICGPTAIGKTAIAIEVAKQFQTEILSADSRQFYREMTIGTAKPSAQELAAVPHHFINNLSIQDEYTAGMYEKEAIARVEELFKTHDEVVMVGGSGLFIKAVCEGFDSFKGEEVSEAIKSKFRDMPLGEMQKEVARLDPEYYAKVDAKNPRRLQRALEVMYSTRKKYSDQRTGAKVERNFNIIKIGLELPREILNDRINKRVDAMRKAGLWDEVTALLPYKELQPLQTVGYQEVFESLDGKISKSQAIDKIKQNTRNYAKRQMTWFNKDPEVRWYEPAEFLKVLQSGILR